MLNDTNCTKVRLTEGGGLRPCIPAIPVVEGASAAPTIPPSSPFSSYKLSRHTVERAVISTYRPLYQLVPLYQLTCWVLLVLKPEELVPTRYDMSRS